MNETQEDTEEPEIPRKTTGEVMYKLKVNEQQQEIFSTLDSMEELSVTAIRKAPEEKELEIQAMAPGTIGLDLVDNIRKKLDNYAVAIFHKPEPNILISDPKQENNYVNYVRLFINSKVS